MPHRLNTYVNKRFSQTLPDSTRDVVVQQSSMPLFENYKVPKIKSQILQSQKIQSNRHILEWDKGVCNIQDFFISATYPVTKLWQDIYDGQEVVSCEIVVDNIQQSLCHISSTFYGLNVHRKKRLKSCLTKDFQD